MSDTSTEIAVPHRALEQAPRGRRPAARWSKRLLLFLIFLWLADAGISLLMDHTRLRGDLTAHLEAVFGRPVEVGSYHFVIWKGPILEARTVSVGEDPRFGNEYLLRADSLTVRLRWRSLLRGRFELGTLSLSHPSLNIVRNARGEWNLAEWLPRPAETLSPDLHGPPSAPRFRRIEVDDGRIDFKRGDEKLPFAFITVSGAVEMEDSGLWNLDLEAAPWRAGVVVQLPGVIRLAGRVGGTSSRLSPAMLALSWQDVSVSDALRLARGNDFGTRGDLALSIAAHMAAGAWAIQGRAELRQLHRWDLPLRPDDPSFNIIADGKVDPHTSSATSVRVTLEAPHSSAHAVAQIDWAHAGTFGARESSPFLLQVPSSKIGLDDVLAWLRAFRPGVVDSVSVRGWLNASGVVAGWPPHIQSAAVSTDGAALSDVSLPAPTRLGRAQFRYDRGLASLLPVVLSFGPAAGQLSVESSAKLGPHESSFAHVSGEIADAGDLLAAARSLGWELARGYEIRGPLSCDLRWQGAPFPWRAKPAGWIAWNGASLRAPFLNLPVEQIRAHVEFQRGARRVTLTSAEAFGTRWNGILDRPSAEEAWRFTLSAGRLSAAELDRWLNPRWRQSFFGRILPFLNSASPVAGAAPESLRASGRLSAAGFTLPPVSMDRLQGNLKIEGRRIELTDATSQFYGGDTTVSLDAQLLAAPEYAASVDFSRVDLSSLTTAFPSLAGFFAGEASGQIFFFARGATRTDLASSLECHGAARLSSVTLYSMDLEQSLRAAALLSGTTSFRQGSAAFSCGQGRLFFQDLSLVGPGADVDASGSVDFARHLDLRLRLLAPAALAAGAPLPRVAPGGTYHLAGSLGAPQITTSSTPRRIR